jgi:multidrug efflux pump subunit AcrB
MLISKIALKKYQFTLVVFVIITLFGIVSYSTMPKSEDPYAEYHTTTVLVINPGASPEDMETLIVDPIEKSINELDGIKNITTSIQDGVSFSFVEHNIGQDYDKKHQEIIQKVNEVRGNLPETIYKIELGQPSVLNVAIYQLAFVSKGATPIELKKSAEDLKKKLEKINGIRKVAIHAEQELEVQVKCDMERLAAYNLTLNRIIAILQSENLSIPGGSIDLGNRKFNVQTSGLYKSLSEIENTVINAGANGIVLLGDVAQVTFDYKKPDVKGRYNANEAVWLTIEQKKGINIYRVSEQVEALIQEHKQKLGNDMMLETVMCQAEGVKARVNGFFINFIQGILLVGAIILLALGLRSAIIVIITIPVSVFAAIGLIDIAGYGLQQMSIAGLIIALGMLVDNSIAVVENIYRYIGKGFKPIDAAIKSISEIGLALVSSTVTTVLAFVPMLMMNNDVGNFIKSMVLIVIYALLASLFVALCLTPFLGSRLLKKSNKPDKTGFLDLFVENHYSKWIQWALNKPKAVIIASVIIFFGSLSLMPLIGVSFFPKADKSQLMINAKGIDGTNLANTEQALIYIENEVAKIPEVEKTASTIGEGNPQVYYNMLQPNPSATLGQVYVMLKPTKPQRMNEIIAELRQIFDQYPGAKIEVKEFIQGPPVDAPVQIRLFSENLDDLKIAAAQVEKTFTQVPGIINISNPFSVDKTDLQIKIDREKAGRLGVNLVDIDRVVRTAVNGLELSNYQDQLGEKYSIVLKAREDNTKDLSWINKVFVPTALGSQIQLSQVADIELKKGIKRIDHYDLDRYVSILADVDESVQSIDKATKAAVAKLNTLDLQGDVIFTVGGEAESRDESFGGLGQSLLVALLGIFAVLVLQFGSFKQPLIIFTAIPLSITGSFITLLITGYSFSFMAFVGLTSLMGIVINSSILLVDYANQLVNEGALVSEAAKEASKTRFVPIMLTTTTTVAGLLPLTLFGGSMWAPMGWAIIGGLLFSTLLTLILVPVLYQSFTKNEISN